MANKAFLDLLSKLEKTHRLKNEDYSKEDESLSNFHQAATIVSWFNKPIDQVFAAVIGIKLSRLANLRNKNKAPNNESIQDTTLDLTAYCGLLHAVIVEEAQLVNKEKDIEYNYKKVCKHSQLMSNGQCYVCNSIFSPDYVANKYNKNSMGHFVLIDTPVEK